MKTTTINALTIATLLASLTGCASLDEKIAECQQENGYDAATCLSKVQYEQQQSADRWIAASKAMDDFRRSLNENAIANAAQPPQLPRQTTCRENSFNDGTIQCTTF